MIGRVAACLWFVGYSLVAMHGNTLAGEVRVSTRDQLVRALDNAKAGTTIVIAPGEYRGGIAQAKLTGEKGKPIVIAGADPAKPPVIAGGASGLHLSSPSFVEVRDLIIQAASGNGLNIDDGRSTDAPAHDLVLSNLVIRDIGPRGNSDGIKLSGVRDFQVAKCRVERWGNSGSAIDMVGCTKGSVKECRFTEATGDAANGVQTKGGSSEIVIQHCRFENAGGRAVNVGGSTNLDYIRPHDANYEAKSITVEDCEFIGGMAAIAFVGVDTATIRHNTIFCPTRWPFRILQENTNARFVPCRNGKVEKNVIVFRADKVREVVNIGGKTAPETFAFAGNTWACLDRPDDTQRLVRLPVKEADATYGSLPKFKDAAKGELQIANRQANDAGARPPEAQR